MTPKLSPFEVVALHKTSLIFVYFSWLTLNWFYASAFEKDYITLKKADLCLQKYQFVDMLMERWIWLKHGFSFLIKDLIQVLIKEMLENKYFWPSNVNIKVIAMYYLAASKKIGTQPLQSCLNFYMIFYSNVTLNHWILPIAFSNLSAWLNMTKTHIYHVKIVCK